MMKEIVLATKSIGKISEMYPLLKFLPIEIRLLTDFDNLPDAVENGNTFGENALLKAKFFCKQTNLACLADDSGLEVEALDGLPGVHSARFAGYHADDFLNNQKLLEELRKRKVTESSACYRCALAFVDINDTNFVILGKLCGKIRTIPHGKNGLGYDPYFYIDDNTTVADISRKKKNAISHRGSALRSMISKLKEYLKEQDTTDKSGN